MTCTIFENIFIKDKPHYISVNDALGRIKSGKSQKRIEEIRNTIDKDRQDKMKLQLPSVCFSGKFEIREDAKIIEHSGFLVLDFDKVQDVGELAASLVERDFIYSLWLSPRGNGLKALVRIADGKKHRQHFAALKEIFPDVDDSGKNESRVCYESYDPNIYINENAKIFTKTLTVEKIKETNVLQNETEIFLKLLKWISNKGDAFQSGERNIFIFKLASSCCRFGIHEDSALHLIAKEYPTTNDFTLKELNRTISSAYKRNNFATAQFEFETLVDKKTRKEVEICNEIIDDGTPVKDVVYGEYVKDNAMSIFNNGYANLKGLDIPDLDYYFKEKTGEVTCLTGIGNYGKSTWFKWRKLIRILKYGEKFATFSPEDNPPEEYYHDFVEMLLGCNCTPENPYRPPAAIYSNAYDFISKHLFYIYPKDLIPSPTYIKERFLELIIKEKITGVCIDPFNQMTHDYSKSGGRSDKYLETTLGDFSRFAQVNNIHFTIIAHPVKLPKQANGNYPCPDIFDLADGAMWNNKMDNILVYHRPLMQTDPNNPTCEIHSKKIRRQKTVGKKGMLNVDYSRKSRRYEINGIDYISQILREKQLDFSKPVL